MCISLQDHGMTSWFITIAYLFVAAIFACVQLKSLNTAMECYDQIEIIPLYQTALILMNITSGILILNEQEMYRAYQIGALTGCSLICIMGIYLIVERKSVLTDDPLLRPQIQENEIPLMNQMK